MEHPIEIKIVSVLVATNGLVTFLNVLPDPVLGAGINLDLIRMLFALILFALAWGLWMLEHWAWPLAFGIEIFNAIFISSRLFTAPSAIGPWINIIIVVAVLYLLTRPIVRDAFSQQARL